MPLDLAFVREQYPTFQMPEMAEWAFFENAGGSYVPRQVVDRLDNFFRRHKVQPYGPFEPSIAAGGEMDAGYQCIADLLNVGVDELTLGPSTTMNCYVLAQAIRPSLQPGDEIVITNQDHEANIGCWERLREFGAEIKWWQIDPQSGELSVDELQSLLSSRTRLVCFNLCSNIVGTFHNLKEITDLVHEAGAISVGDGVSFAPHKIVDANKLGVDIYVFSTYKTFGTHVGAMWIRDGVSEQLACQGHYFNADKPHYRMNPCGPLHAEIAALAGIGEYFDTLYDHHFDSPAANRHERAAKLFELVADHETRLANQLLETLVELPNVRVIGQTAAMAHRRAPTISFVPGNRRPSEVAKHLATQKVAVRNGHFYALRCLQALGLTDTEEGVLRVSLVHYNTPAEVQRLTDGLRALCT